MQRCLVLKIGGSIFDKPAVLQQFSDVFTKTIHPSITYIILMGGGRKCNQLRMKYKSDSNIRQSEDWYHWQSIKIMGENAEVMRNFLENSHHPTVSQLVTDLSKIRRDKGGIYILQPFEDLYKNDPLEHSWNVTSDSITMYYVHKFRCSLCVLVKYNPYLIIKGHQITRISNTNLIQEQNIHHDTQKLGKGIMDTTAAYLCGLYNIPILVLNGANKEKVSNFFTMIPKYEESTALSSFGIEIFPDHY